jgi:hypothetical protein
LQSPEKQGRQPGIFLQRTGRAIPGTGLGCSENLFKGGSSDDFPDLQKVVGQLHFLAVGGLDLPIAAEDLQGRADAGENKVRAAYALVLEPFHPIADAIGEFTQDFTPVADGCVVGARTANQVDTGGKGRSVPRE